LSILSFFISYPTVPFAPTLIMIGADSHCKRKQQLFVL
jgi:hypothetical protein